MLGSSVGDREARADGQGGELIDRVAAGAPVRKLLFVELLGHPRLPFTGYRPDHRAGIKLAAIDAHRAAEAALGQVWGARCSIYMGRNGRAGRCMRRPSCGMPACTGSWVV
jgi:hypothetical protein